MLAIGSAFLGIGLKNVLLALVVLAVPPIITNAYVGVDQVDPRPRRRGARDGHDRLADAAAGRAAAGDPAGDGGRAHGGAVRRLDDHDRRATPATRDSLGEIVNNEASYHLSGVLGAAICIARWRS